MKRSHSQRAVHDLLSVHGALLWIIAIAAAIWVLQATFSVTMPIVLGFTLALLLLPVQRATQARVPPTLSWLGPISALILLLCCVAVIVLFIAWSMDSVAQEAPRYVAKYHGLRRLLEEYGIMLPGYGDAAYGSADSSTESADSEEAADITSLVRGFLIRMWELAGISVLTVFFMLLMLLEADEWARRIRAALGERSKVLCDIVEVMDAKVRAFLWVRTIISLITGIAAAAWFFIIGIDFWYLWGLLAFVLNYIPFVGSIIAAIPPVLLALVTKDWTIALIAAAGSMTINAVIGNLIDPRIEGETLSVSPVVLLAGLVFWSWVWGWPGAFLSVPLTTALVVVLAQIDDLKKAALLLSHSGSVEELDKDMRTY